MKKISRKKGGWCRFAAAMFSILLFAGSVSAQEMSDFEKLLKDAIRSNQEGLASEAAVKSEPEKLVPGNVKSATKESTKKTTPQAMPQPKPLDSARKNKATADEGWTAVAPHEKKEVPAATANTTVPVLVADTTMPGSAAPDVSVWNAVPETVEPEAVKTEASKEEETKPASPWDVVAVDDEAKAPLNWNTVALDGNDNEDGKAEVIPWSASDSDAKEQSTEEPVKEEPKSELPKIVPSADEEPKKEESTPELPKIVEPKKEEPKSDDTTSGDMTDILNALEKDKEKKQEDKKPVAEKEEPKKTETAEVKPTESKPETAKTEEPKSGKPKVEVKLGPLTIVEEPADEQAEKKSDAKAAEPAKVVVRELPEPTFPDFDADTDETKYKLVDAGRVGDPHAKDKIRLMYDEIVNGLKSRNVTGRYEMWKNYAKSTLRNTAGLNTGSELDGRCRLEWYKSLFADPIKSVFEVEEFSRSIHHGLSGSHRHIAETMGKIREKMDVPARNDDGVRFLECKTPFDAVNEVKRCLLEAQMAHAKAISTLTSAELTELEKSLVSTFSGSGCVNGHTIPNRTYGRRLTNMLEKMDKSALYDASEALLPLTNPALLALLDKLPEDAFPTSMISGQTVQRISTAAGDIVISGREGNSFDLDSSEMLDVVCLISLGGNDHIREGTCGLHRPVLAIVNLHGNDTYSGSRPGIQGGSILGVSILVDVEGDDKYSAGDVAQGSSIGGAGMLFDFDGKDDYRAIRRCQGHALCGLGMLIDRKGNDKYRAALWAQGFGAPGGFGVLNDVEGNDHYYCGGMWADSYPEHPGYDGWGQGVGAGLRQVGNGGIGMILDGAGDDGYEVDYFGHGGGYWLGVGVARDFGGNDIRHGTTRSAYNGGPRQQAEWTRFANGFGCHYALGFLFDDAGNDVYGGKIMGTGMAWDLSIGYLCDFGGNDRFTATGGMTQGVGAEGSIGILFSYGGNDEYLGRNQGYASSGISYHSASNCGANFSFLINYGGNDKYGCGVKNNSYAMRGSQTGYLIDRPTDREAAEELKQLAEMITKREKEIEEYDEMVKKGREEAAEKGRRYAPRTRRPVPISADQIQRLGSVPHFESTARTGGNDVNVK